MNIRISGPNGRPSPRWSAVIGRYAKSVIYRSDYLIADFATHAKWHACATALAVPLDCSVRTGNITVTLHETPDDARYDSLFDRRLDKQTV